MIKNKNKHFLKNSFFKILLSFLFLFLGSSFLDFTAFMEPELQDNKILSSDDESNETWTDWAYKNQKNILVTTIIIFLTGTILYFYQKNIQINLANIAEVPVPDIDILLSSLEMTVTETLYDNILTIVTNIIEDPECKSFGLEILEKMLNSFKTNIELSSQIKNQDDFGELLRALIEEIKKK